MMLTVRRGVLGRRSVQGSLRTFDDTPHQAVTEQGSRTING